MSENKTIKEYAKWIGVNEGTIRVAFGRPEFGVHGTFELRIFQNKKNRRMRCYDTSITCLRKLQNYFRCRYTPVSRKAVETIETKIINQMRKIKNESKIRQTDQPTNS